MPPDPFDCPAPYNPYGYHEPTDVESCDDDDDEYDFGVCVLPYCERIRRDHPIQLDYAGRLFDPDWTVRPAVRAHACHLQRLAEQQRKLDQHMRRVRVVRGWYGAPPEELYPLRPSRWRRESTE